MLMLMMMNKVNDGCYNPDSIRAVEMDGRPHEKRPTNKFVTVVKSTWYTVAILLLLFGAAVIFMGIEGNAEKYANCAIEEEKEHFNRTLYEWLRGPSDGAVTLRQSIGVTEATSFDEGEALLAAQFEVNYTNIQKVLELKCMNATITLTSWDNKTNGDAVMYAASIISTVGWGRYYPRSNLCRVITMLYAVLGLPIFAATCNWFMLGIRYTEKKLKKMIDLEKLVGTDKLYIPLATLIIVLFTLFNAGLVFLLVEVTMHSRLVPLLIDTDNEDDWSFATSFYYTAITVATIGFGDLYIWSPGHVIVTVKTVVCLFISSILIAMFSIAFSRLQAYFEKKVEKDVNKTNSQIRNNRKKAKRAPV